MKKVLILQNTIHHYRKAVFNELSRHYDVTVVHSGRKSVGADDLYKEVIIPVRKIGPFQFQPGALTAAKGSGYEIVIAMFDVRWLANIFALFAAPTKRFLYWGHTYSESRMVNLVRDFLMRKCDGVLLYSGIEIDRMIANGIRPERIFIAHNTVEVSNHTDCSGCEKDSFLFVGRAQKRKQVDQLIRAFSEIRESLPGNVTINIIGEGEENENLKRLADELGIRDRVRFLGEINDNDALKPFFQRAYAYVSPGPVGLGVLHSFAYGVPVVTNFSGKHGPEFSNLSDGVNSLLFRTQDDLKNILKAFFDGSRLSSRMGRNAYLLYSESRTIRGMVEGFISAIENSHPIGAGGNK